MSDESSGEKKKDNRDTKNVSMDGHADRTAEQIGLHLQHSLVHWDKEMYCNMVFSPLFPHIHIGSE